MKNYRIELENNTELIDKLKERLEEIIFNESQDEFDIDIIIYTSSLNDKVIFKVYEEFIFSNVKIYFIFVLSWPSLSHEDPGEMSCL